MAGGIVREIDQHWPAGRFEQLQGSPQDAGLKGGITWDTERSPNSKGTQRARGGVILTVCSRTRLIWVVGTPSPSR